MVHGQTTVAQEKIVSTKIKIYTVLLQKFGVSETKFCPSPPVLQSSDQVPSFIIPQNKPKSVLVHPLKGHQDWTTLSRVKGGVKIILNPETPCRSIHKRICSTYPRFGKHFDNIKGEVHYCRVKFIWAW